MANWKTDGPAVGDAARRSGGERISGAGKVSGAHLDPDNGRASGARPAAGDSSLEGIQERVHRRLLDRLNLQKLSQMSRDEAEAGIRAALHDLLDQEAAPLNSEERVALIKRVLDEIFGLGPLEPLMLDPEISDILVNTSRLVYVERRGVLHPTDIRFRDDRHLLRVIDRIVSAVGRRIDESAPMVDARLPDGSRVNA